MLQLKGTSPRITSYNVCYTKLLRIRGPVVLDFSREITPLLSKFDEVPVLVNLTKGMNEEQIRAHFVITSYSIHYTKLYENLPVCPKRGQGRLLLIYKAPNSRIRAVK